MERGEIKSESLGKQRGIYMLIESVEGKNLILQPN